MRVTNHLSWSSETKSYSADKLAWTARSFQPKGFGPYGTNITGGNEALPDSTTFGTMSQRTRAAWLLEQISQEVVQGNIGVLPAAEKPTTSRAHVAKHPASSTQVPKLKRPVQRQLPHRPSGQQVKELPAWAREGQEEKSREYDPRDPLRIYEAWDGWGKAFVWGSGGCIIMGVVWAVAVQAWAFKH
jgi:hypothetical protein